MIFLSILVGIIIILILITLHEFGHFIAAKIFKIYVYEFSIGIGPKIISWRKKETKYSIRLFPFGGYVYAASEFLDPPKGYENVEIPVKRFIEGISRFKRILIVLSGILMNFIVALILFTSIFTITKCSPVDTNGYGANYYTTSDSPAYILTLDNNNKKNPEIITDISFFYSKGNSGQVNYDDIDKNIIDKNHKIINSINNFNNFYNTSIILQNYLKTDIDINSDKNFSNTLFVKYGNYDHLTHKIINVTDDWRGYRYDINNKKYQSNGHYLIGMTAPDYYFANSSEGYVYGWKKMFEESVMILEAFGKLFTGNWSQLSGPIGTIEQTKSFISYGPETFFLYVAILSANLFVLNLIFIPPLDGFKFLILFIESIIRRDVNQKLKLFITLIGVILFAILIIGLTLKDIFM